MTARVYALSIIDSRVRKVPHMTARSSEVRIGFRIAGIDEVYATFWLLSTDMKLFCGARQAIVDEGGVILRVDAGNGGAWDFAARPIRGGADGPCPFVRPVERLRV